MKPIDTTSNAIANKQNKPEFDPTSIAEHVKMKQNKNIKSIEKLFIGAIQKAIDEKVCVQVSLPILRHFKPYHDLAESKRYQALLYHKAIRKIREVAEDGLMYYIIEPHNPKSARVEMYNH